VLERFSTANSGQLDLEICVLSLRMLIGYCSHAGTVHHICAQYLGYIEHFQAVSVTRHGKITIFAQALPQKSLLGLLKGFAMRMGDTLCASILSMAPGVPFLGGVHISSTPLDPIPRGPHSSCKHKSRSQPQASSTCDHPTSRWICQAGPSDAENLHTKYDLARGSTPAYYDL